MEWSTTWRWSRCRFLGIEGADAAPGEVCLVLAGHDPDLGSGVLSSLASFLGQGNPLLWSALLPLLAIALLFGVRSLRPGLAGLCFGVAGALLFAACALPADIRFIPNVLDRAWLLANAILATGLGSLVLRR